MKKSAKVSPLLFVVFLSAWACFPALAGAAAPAGARSGTEQPAEPGSAEVLRKGLGLLFPAEPKEEAPTLKEPVSPVVPAPKSPQGIRTQDPTPDKTARGAQNARPAGERRADKDADTAPKNRPESPPAAQAAAPESSPSVSFTDENQERLARRGIVRAELQSSGLMILSAPYNAIIASVQVRDGESVEQGKIVAGLDLRRDQKALADARTALAAVVERLADGRPRQPRDQSLLEAEIAREADKVSAIEERMAQGSLTAPMSGRVTEIRARPGQHVKQGEAIMEIAETDALEIVCQVPSSWVRWLQPGHVIWIYVDETAKSYEAEFVRLGGKVDPSAKRIKAYSRFVETPPALLPGMSGAADFRLPWLRQSQ